MQRESPEDRRPPSRRNSAPSRRNSLKKDDKKEGPTSASSTPKKVVRNSVADFVVTGKQIAKRSDRANSLPGSSRSHTVRNKRPADTERAHSKGRSNETSLQHDMSLHLSQVSDLDDTSCKSSLRKPPLATSTPKPRPGPKPRSASLQSHISHITQVKDSRRSQKSLDDAKSRDSVFSASRDSLYKTSSSASPLHYRYGTELDYSSVSPEYSQSSADLSPRTTDLVLSPRSQHNLSSPLTPSCCVSTWAETSGEGEAEGEVAGRGRGEWDTFWINYNNSLSKVPMKSYYDQCPTPYRTENIDLNDFDFSIDSSRKRSPDNMDNINNIIRNEGLQLTPRETQNIIKCAHILGNVLSKAIERRSRETPITERDRDTKRKNLTLDLKETAIAMPQEKRSETVTTQTDISLPNTKSAPRIFENILRQLSKSSIDEDDEGVEKEKTEEDA